MHFLPSRRAIMLARVFRVSRTLGTLTLLCGSRGGWVVREIGVVMGGCG
jgi:hypothetical protein